MRGDFFEYDHALHCQSNLASLTSLNERRLEQVEKKILCKVGWETPRRHEFECEITGDVLLLLVVGGCRSVETALSLLRSVGRRRAHRHEISSLIRSPVHAQNVFAPHTS